MPLATDLPPSPPADLASPRPLAGPTILLVEDSAYSADVLRRLAWAYGARLRRAGDLASARVHLSLYRPDVVMVDLGLPDGGGLDLVAELSVREGAAPLVIALSGDEDLARASLAAGAAVFWDKARLTLDVFRTDLDRLMPRGAAVRLPSEALLRAPDPLCLQEDLERAESWLEASGAPSRYLSNFLLGLGRLARDPALASAARRFGSEADGALPELRRLIAHRRAARGKAMVTGV